MIVNFEIGCTVLLQVYAAEKPDVLAPPFSPAAACGDLVYVRNAKREILIVDYKSVPVVGLVPVSR